MSNWVCLKMEYTLVNHHDVSYFSMAILAIPHFRRLPNWFIGLSKVIVHRIACNMLVSIRFDVFVLRTKQLPGLLQHRGCRAFRLVWHMGH